MKITRRGYILILFLLLIFFMIIPFVLQWILFNETVFPFNIRIKFSREVWFGFIASYLGVLGTIALGVIALWQNKRYKELADKSSQESDAIQKELRDLTEKTNSAIQTLERIEVLKYYPAVEKTNTTYFSLNKKFLLESFDNDDFSILPTYVNVGLDDITDSIIDIADEYNTFAIAFKNISEKRIVNFRCSELMINGKTPSVLMFGNCDIESGKYAAVIISAFPEIEEGEIVELKMKFMLNNFVMENYCMDYEVIIMLDDDGFNDHIIQLTPPYKKE